MSSRHGKIAAAPGLNNVNPRRKRPEEVRDEVAGTAANSCKLQTLSADLFVPNTFNKLPHSAAASPLEWSGSRGRRSPAQDVVTEAYGSFSNKSLSGSRHMWKVLFRGSM